MIVTRIKQNWIGLLLVVSLCCVSFSYGVIVGWYKVFPFNTIRDAQTASLALLATRHPVDLVDVAVVKDQVLVPTARNHGGADGHELILVSGGQGYLSDHHEAGCLAWLIDRRGDVKHIWNYDSSVWDDRQKVTSIVGVSDPWYPVGLHLYDNGDLLVSYQGGTTFPFAVGIARFDKHSRLVWKKELLTHHWMTVAEDGRIFTPALRVVDSPLPIGDTAASINSDTGKIYSDVVLILDENGNVLDEIPMLDAVFASGWAGLLMRGDGQVVNTDDPLHLNDVQLVGTELAKSQPWLSRGDLLVSFRNINAVGILDVTTRRFKWMSSGWAVGQHSPRFYDHGILVLDNLGGNERWGITQLVKIDFERRSPTTVFPLSTTTLPDTCRTKNSGHLDVHRDGNRVLMALTNQGAVWEVDPRSGELLWEYLYVHPHDDGTRRAIFTAKYVYEARFLTEGEES